MEKIERWLGEGLILAIVGGLRWATPRESSTSGTRHRLQANSQTTYYIDIGSIGLIQGVHAGRVRGGYKNTRQRSS